MYTVIYHANCADGFTAAWCFYRSYRNNIAFHPGVYGQEPPDVTDKYVYLVDFSYPKAVILDMLSKAKGVTILDHHITAIEDLKDLHHEKLLKIFDTEKSGATLAWDYCFSNMPRPKLIEHIEDRDLWRFKLPLTSQIQAAVFSYEYTFENWDKLIDMDVMRLAEDGFCLERKHMKDINELLKVCERRMTIGGYNVPVASLPYTMVSDAANIMALKSEPFAACYYDTADHRVFGLRSNANHGLDVSKVAAAYGGGGHKHAAGFRVPRNHELAVS